jgi:DNA mismatch repair protein MutS
MYKEYIELYKTYTQKYGPKTAIFLMVGSFYELYDIQDNETGRTECNVREIVDYLGIQLSTKKGDFAENQDGLFAGFPDYVMHKWAGRLTSAGWTVVIVDQIKDSRGKVKERKVSRILSPSTHIENTNSTDIPYVVTIAFYQQTNLPPSFGVGALDLTTGTTHTYSGTANGRYDIWTADDLIQFMSVFQPKELIIYWNSPHNIPDEIYFRRIFGILPNIPLHIHSVETLGTITKELVRAEYLQKIYTIRSILPPKTYLGLRTESEEMSLLYLLQFVEEHYPSMLRSFHRNNPWIPQARLICGNHALTQLQITGSNLHETVIGIFDKSISVMGKRAIRERLLSPYSIPEEIRLKLQEVSNYMTWSEENTKQLEKQLRFMYDLPRLHRKILCGLITPQEIAGLFQTYNAMHHIMKNITVNTLLHIPFTEEEWMNYQTMFRIHFSEEDAFHSDNNRSAFNNDTYPEIGKKEKEIQEILEKYQLLRSIFVQKGGVAEDAVRLEERDKEPYGLKASSVTLQQLKKKLEELPEGTKITELKSGGWIDCAELQRLNTRLQRARESLSHLVKTYLPDACQAISDAGQTIWSQMETWISHIDCTQCIGRVSKERGFSYPCIEDIDEKGSFVEIEQVRHPLVEVSSTRISYVKHSIKLGGESANGWLVYGMNASGKSTLMKATGICILLAQAGCFVPAKYMKLAPFQAIYTRILNQDNLFAGLSSFAVEMSELRDILRNATPYTLVLGDELCAGTESTSAQALVASGIQWLSSRSTKFIFATHLHDLPKLIDMEKERVEVWHLHVDYDPVTKKLVYDRSLRSGSGSTLYGLEVARAMDLPFEFIEQALMNRHRINDSTTQENARSSSWNKEIVRKECELCKKQIQSELEVHHLQERSRATNGRLEDGTHMNEKRNLIVICQKCHDDLHSGKMEVGEMKTTSEGPEREIRITEIEEKEEKRSKKSKWSEDELETIKNTLLKYSSLSLKSIQAKLSSAYQITISETNLSKMRKELRD